MLNLLSVASSLHAISKMFRAVWKLMSCVESSLCCFNPKIPMQLLKCQGSLKLISCASHYIFLPAKVALCFTSTTSGYKQFAKKGLESRDIAWLRRRTSQICGGRQLQAIGIRVRSPRPSWRQSKRGQQQQQQPKKLQKRPAAAKQKAHEEEKKNKGRRRG